MSGAPPQEESDEYSDSSDSDGDSRAGGTHRFKQERKDVSQFAGQFSMLSGEVGTASPDQVPESVQQDRVHVVAFVEAAFEAGDAQVQDVTPVPTTMGELWGFAKVDENERAVPCELTTMEGITRLRTGGYPQANSQEIVVPTTAQDVSAASEEMETERADPPFRSPTHRNGAARCQDVERAGMLIVEQQCQLDLDDGAVAAMGSKGDEVDPFQDDLRPVRAGPCPHAYDDDCSEWGCPGESDVSDWAEGAAFAGADDGGSRRMQRFVQDENRRQHVVVARPMEMDQEGQLRDDSNPRMTRAEHACQLQEIALNTRTSIACTWRDGIVHGAEYANYLHFDIYGDGHDCFQCAREIAEHYAVMEEGVTPHTDDHAERAAEDWLENHVFEDCLKAPVITTTRPSYPDVYVICTRRSPPTRSFQPGSPARGTMRPPQTAATQGLVIQDIQQQTGTRIRCRLSANRAFTYFTIRGAGYQRAADLLANHSDIVARQRSTDYSEIEDGSDEETYGEWRYADCRYQ